MSREVAAGIVVLVIAVAIGLMVLSWTRRRRRQAGLGSLAAVPTALAPAVFTADVLYVATTRSDEPLERVAVAGLGFRSRAVVAVSPDGIVLGIAGSSDGFIPAADIRGSDRATWTIDRVVEKDGLVLLAWTLGGQPVDSYFRAPEPSALLDAFRVIAPPHPEAPQPDAPRPGPTGSGPAPFEREIP